MSRKFETSQYIDLLRDEYLLLQNQYEDFDKRSITIKGWITSGAIAALALGITSDKPNAPAIPLITSAIVGFVWYLEAHWKLFQYALSDRIRILEAYFRQDKDILEKDPDPFQIYHWWFKSYSQDEPIYEYERSHGRPRGRRKRLAKVAFQRFVFIPYLPIIVLALISAATMIWPEALEVFFRGGVD